MTQPLPRREIGGALLAALDEHSIVSVADTQGDIVYVNGKFCEVSGYAADELIGRNHRLLKSGIHDAAFYRGMWDEISAGRRWHGEICNRRKSGELYWVEATIVPEIDAAGLPSRYVSIRTEITAVKQAQMRAQMAEQRLRQGQAAGEIGTWELDLETGLFSVSDRVGPLVGRVFTAGNVPYEGLLVTVHADDRPAVREALEASAAGNTRFEIAHRCVWPDGSVRWLLQRGAAVASAGGPRRLLGVVQDITGERSARAELELLRHAVDATGEGLALCDLATQEVSYLNPAGRVLLGRAGDAAQRLDPMRLAPPAARAAFEAAFAEATRGRAAHVAVDDQRTDGTSAHLHHVLTPVRDATGAVSHVVDVFGDRSEEIRQQHQLQQALDEARRANRAKADFMSRMSHELRTPLNAILGFSQVLLLREGLDETQTDSVREVLKAGRHLLDLIDDVLDIARIDLGALRVSIEPVAVAPLLAHTVALLAPAAQDKGVELAFDAADPALGVRADHLRLKQCLINLLSNAIKYNHRGGWVRVAARPLGAHRVRIEVQDNGAGIAAAELPQLFNAFTRLESHRQLAEGSGIGLSITQRLVELMSGRIEVFSEAGSGSTFSIELERADVAEEVNPAGSVAAIGNREIPAQDARKRVLYVEDNPANLKLVSSMLRLLPDLVVMTAGTAAEGMALARDERPDLILLDIGLPGASGFDMLSWLRADARLAATPVIAISANAMPADVKRGRDAGFDDYLTKPVDIHALLGRVQSILAADTT